MEVASAEETDGVVRAVYAEALRELAARLRSRPSSGIEAADRRMTIEVIERFLERPMSPRPLPAQPAIPPGPPIGG